MEKYVTIFIISILNVQLMVSAGIISSKVKDGAAVTNNNGSSTVRDNFATTASSLSARSKSGRVTSSDGQIASDTNQKATRQIFPGSKQEATTEEDHFSNSRPSRPSSGGRKPSNAPEQSDGFPQDFSQGFQDSHGPERDPQNAGFSNFPSEDKFASVSSDFGDLKPLAASPRPPSTTRVTNANLPTEDSKPNSAGPQQHFAPEDESFDPQFRPPSHSGRPALTSSGGRGRPPFDDFGGGGFDDGFRDSGRGFRPSSDSFQDERVPPQDDSRFQVRRPPPPPPFQADPIDSFQPSLDDGGHAGQLEDSSRARRPQSTQRKPTIADDQPTNFDFPESNDQFGPGGPPPPEEQRPRGRPRRPIAQPDSFDDTFNLPPPSDQPRPRAQKPSSRPPPPPEDPRQFDTFDDNGGQSFPIRKPSSSSSPNTKFRDADQFDFSQQQRFVPITQFNDGPFPEFGGFRPLTSTDDQRGGFRSDPSPQRHHHQQPQHSFGGQFDNSEFSDADPNVFSQQDPAEDGRSSHFGASRPQNFHQQDEPDFNKAQDFDDQPRSQQSTQTGRHRAQRLHNDDSTNHHSSATNNILGSGNFGVIRGGIFADNDNSHRQSHFQPVGRNSHFHRGDDDDDFFSGFRDFQPFGGSLHNALSSHSQNVHNRPLTTDNSQFQSHFNTPIAQQSGAQLNSQHKNSNSTASTA